MHINTIPIRPLPLRRIPVETEISLVRENRSPGPTVTGLREDFPPSNHVEISNRHTRLNRHHDSGYHPYMRPPPPRPLPILDPPLDIAPATRLRDNEVYDDRINELQDGLNFDGGFVESNDPVLSRAMSKMDIRELQLVLMETKDLNKMIKTKGLDKEEARTIKARRRTLKNRGYAANCRVKRDDEEETLRNENLLLMTDITQMKHEEDKLVLEIAQERERIKEDLRAEIRDLKMKIRERTR